MTAEEMKTRTRAFALQVILLSKSFPKDYSTGILARQLVRSATSVGANYRSACLARSTADFAGKLQIALEEADESQYWLELLTECRASSGAMHEAAYKESKEIAAMLMAAVKSTRMKLRPST